MPLRFAVWWRGDGIPATASRARARPAASRCRWCPRPGIALPRGGPALHLPGAGRLGVRPARAAREPGARRICRCRAGFRVHRERSPTSGCARRSWPASRCWCRSRRPAPEPTGWRACSRSRRRPASRSTWCPPRCSGVRSSEPPSLWNLPFGNPYDPPGFTRWLRLLRRGYARVVIGTPGTRTALEAQSHAPGDKLALVGVRARAGREGALARAAPGVRRPLQGAAPARGADPRPRRASRTASPRPAPTQGLTREESLARGEKALRELATSHNLFSMEIFRRFSRWVYSLAFDPAIDVDPGELEQAARARPARAAGVHPVAQDRTATTWRCTRSCSRRASRRRTPPPASTCRSSR